jgi:drug/metabolite transporter (DMT)-like permease
MFYLIVAILLNVVISSAFKLFPKYKIDMLEAVVVNYILCVITGCIFIGHIPVYPAVIQEPWFPWALLTGVGFIAIFNVLGYSTRVDGITTTTIANKLSLVIPVIFSVFLYGDHMGTWKVIGIVLAFPAVYLTTRVLGDNNKPQGLLWPSLLFFGGGLLDTLMKYAQFSFLASAASQAVYSIYCFATAAAIGIVLVVVLAMLRKININWKNIVAGICIGIPNYFSIYFLIRMLNSNFLQSSAAIPVLNIGIVLASTLTAILLFREKANVLRIAGLVLSVIAILLIAFGDK